MIHNILLRHSCAILALSGGTLTQSSGNPLGTLGGASSNRTSLANADVHAGVSDTFNVALHDTTVAFSAPGAEIGINCPTAERWNEQYARNLTTEGPTDDEKEQQWIVSYMNEHPDQTLWELFTKTLDEDVQKWVNGPSPAEKALDGVVHLTAEVLEELIEMMWAAFKWIVKFPFEYKKESKQIAGHLFADNPINALKEIAGGLFLHLLLHPAEFTAESILLVGAGFRVIHALLDAVRLVGKHTPSGTIETNKVKENHVADFFSSSRDDIYIAGTLHPMSSVVHSFVGRSALIFDANFYEHAQALKAGKNSISIGGSSEENGGFTSDDGSRTVILPAGTLIPASKQCPLLPSDFGAPPLAYGNLCLNSDTTKYREIVFGTPKPSNEMTREERLEAYGHVQKFWCCYGDNGKNSIPLPDSILQDVPGRERWEGKSFWKSVDIDCQKIFNDNPRPSGGRLTIEL
ncbi:hypothetical protein PSTT_06788 [Puccinia striiformis]|uniref:Uncharacterized protein n=1 Tax=Puccinia striiformis TaxID=27350 RepID=A0A2S4VJ03_9BASI|nr:hypothetical protein PSTT_06788 [Puccinia striiformis]